MVNITNEQFEILQLQIESKKKNHQDIGGFNYVKKPHKYGAKKVGKYDSKLEAYMAGLLKIHKIEFIEKEKYVLQEGFFYRDEKIRKIIMIPDFTIKHKNIIIAIVDTKGMITTDWKLKLKILKYKISFYWGGNMFPIYTPHSKKECQEVIRKILDLNK